MTKTAAILIVLTTLSLLTPTAAATGYLVNVNNLGLGFNIFGGQGDTLDLSVANAQCSDEDDFIDLSVASTEGGGNCAQPCTDQPNADGDPLKAIWDTIIPDTYHPTNPHCSDDGDTVDVMLLGTEDTDDRDIVDVGLLNTETSDNEDTLDVGLLNSEGDFSPYCRNDAGQSSEKADRDDGVDVGILNRECGDDLDLADVGIINCEWSDPSDNLDVGVLNGEMVADDDDIFDLSVINAETGDGVDHNGLNILSAPPGLCGLLPVLPTTPVCQVLGIHC